MRDVVRMNLGERTVTVNREKLLETLKANREKHQKDYDEAVAGYKSIATERLQKLMSKSVEAVKDNYDMLLKKLSKFDPSSVDTFDDRVVLVQAMSFDLKVPKNHVSSYDVAIKMAEWEVNETVELTQAQFQCFVMDDWDWQEEFQTIKMSYCGK